MKKYLHYISVLAGILLLGTGFYLMKTVIDPSGILITLPYVCIGIGSGCFGGGMAEIIQKRAIKNSPEIAKKMKIDRLDERNIAIASRAKAKAYDLMIFVFGALMLTYSLMNVDFKAVVLLVCSYLFVIGYGVYTRIKLEKQM